MANALKCEPNHFRGQQMHTPLYEAVCGLAHEDDPAKDDTHPQKNAPAKVNLPPKHKYDERSQGVLSSASVGSTGCFHTKD